MQLKCSCSITCTLLETIAHPRSQGSRSHLRSHALRSCAYCYLRSRCCACTRHAFQASCSSAKQKPKPSFLFFFFLGMHGACGPVDPVVHLLIRAHFHFFNCGQLATDPRAGAISACVTMHQHAKKQLFVLLAFGTLSSAQLAQAPCIFFPSQGQLWSYNPTDLSAVGTCGCCMANQCDVGCTGGQCCRSAHN